MNAYHFVKCFCHVRYLAEQSSKSRRCREKLRLTQWTIEISIRSRSELGVDRSDLKATGACSLHANSQNTNDTSSLCVVVIKWHHDFHWAALVASRWWNVSWWSNESLMMLGPTHNTVHISNKRFIVISKRLCHTYVCYSQRYAFI